MKLEEYLSEKYSKSTLYSNLFNIKRFTDYYQDKAATASNSDILNYIEHLRKNYNLHPKTLRHCLYGVKLYFNYLLATGQRIDHPCSTLYLKDKINKQIQVDNLYSTETLESFYESYTLKRKSQLLKRNQIILSLLIYQALTTREIIALQIQDIDLEKGLIQIQGHYNQRTRKLKLEAKQVLLFYNYLQSDRKKLLKYNKTTPNEQTFLLGQYGEALQPHGINRIINDNRKPSEKIQPIRIRQSVIANLLKKENDTRVVQVFAGHSRASTTVQYKQSDLEVLQSAVNQYHPLQ
jgi:site-specific recombinase XerD